MDAEQVVADVEKLKRAVTEAFQSLTWMAELGARSAHEMLDVTRVQAALAESFEKADQQIKDLTFQAHELQKRVQIMEALLAKKEE